MATSLSEAGIETTVIADAAIFAVISRVNKVCNAAEDIGAVLSDRVFELVHLFSGHHRHTDRSSEWRAEGRQWDTHTRPRGEAPLDTSHHLRSDVQALPSGKKTHEAERFLSWLLTVVNNETVLCS